MTVPHHHPQCITDIGSVISRLPFHGRGVQRMADEFPDAHPLILTNHALALCISSAATWDTLFREEPAQAVSRLLKVRRREACTILGFPGTEATVRILAKIPPEACYPHLIQRLRLALRAPGLNKILQHLEVLNGSALALAVIWGDTPAISPNLFSDLAVECEGGISGPFTGKFLDDSLNVIRERRLAGQPIRTVEEIRRCLDAPDRHDEIADKIADAICRGHLIFPPSPFPGTDEIRPIGSFNMLWKESRQQQHCVVDYAREILEGWVYVYQILAPERATLSIVRLRKVWHCSELKAECNREVSSETLKLVREWLIKSQCQFDERLEALEVMRQTLGTFKHFERRLETRHRFDLMRS